MGSREELNKLHLYLQLTYDHQTQHGGVSNEGLTNLKSHDSFITWSLWGHVKNREKAIPPLFQDLGPLNLAGVWLHGWCSERKSLKVVNYFFSSLSISLRCLHFFLRIVFYHSLSRVYVTNFGFFNMKCIVLSCQVLWKQACGIL